MKYKYNTHHLIPVSRGGSDHEDNLRSLEKSIHEALHKLFINAAPHEQILSVVDLNCGAIISPTIREIREVVLSTLKKGEFYERSARKGEVNSNRIINIDFP